MKKYILVQLKKSNIGHLREHKILLKNLGFNKVNSEILILNTKMTKKILFKIQHLLLINKS
jgi:ribosomal protein L30/L7E